MAFELPLVGGLISIILFLLPGLAGIKLGLIVAQRGDWLGRLDTTGLSFGLSLFAMLVLYYFGSILWSISHGELVFQSQSTVVDLLSTIPSVIGTYSLLVMTSIFCGFILGKIDFGSDYFSSTRPWARFHELAENSGNGETYQVRVKTLAGDEIRGRVEDEGEAALNKDIILENPRRLRLSEEGEVADDRNWSGSAYIHSQGIAHVEFDRLEDADKTEIKGERRESQTSLQEISEEDKKELDELEDLADEGENQPNNKSDEN